MYHKGMLHAREKCVSYVKSENPVSKSYSSAHSSDRVQEKTPVDAVSVQMPSVAAQISLHISGFLVDGNVATVGPPGARGAASADNRIGTEKPYECRECGSAFSNQLYHVCHKKHTGVNCDTIKAEDP